MQPVKRVVVLNRETLVPVKDVSILLREVNPVLMHIFQWEVEHSTREVYDGKLRQAEVSGELE